MSFRSGIFFVCGVLLLMVMSLLYCAWPNLGQTPSKEEQKSFSHSPNYDVYTKRFVNRRQKEYDQMLNNFDLPKLIKQQLFGKEQRTPTSSLPQEIPNWKTWNSYLGLQYIWFGHSTILLRLEGKNILIDPVFDDASPIPFVVPRFQEPPVNLSELPSIDYVVISHDHYGHLSRKSIQHFIGSNTQFIVPLGLSSYLIGWGLNHDKITEFDWWEEINVADITFACTPSQHFSGRLGPKGNKTLWASWVIQGRDERVYFSGDSGYDIHFKEIGKRYGPFDIAFMEDGQYNKIWYMSHLFPNETIQAHVDVQAKKMQPIHFGMFQLAVHDWHEPIYEVLRIAKERNINVLLPKIGEIVQVNETLSFDKWYEIP